MYIGLHVKIPIKPEFFDVFSKKTQILNFLNIVQREPSCSMRKDRRTDMTKLIVAFRNFVNPP